MKQITKYISILLVAVMLIGMIPYAAFAESTPDFADAESNDNAVYLLGDVDLDGDVNVKDATLLQRYLADLVELNEIQMILANVEGTGITVTSVTWIQKYAAELDIGGLKIGQPVDLEGGTTEPDTTPTESRPTESTQPTGTTEPATSTEPQSTEPQSTEPQSTEPEETTPERTPQIPYAESKAIYAHGVKANSDTEEDAWAKWEKFDNVYYIFLPVSSSSRYVEIYNSYTSSIKINGVTIPSKKSKTVEIAVGGQYSVTGAVAAQVKILRSTTEGALYFNTTDNSNNYDKSLFGLIHESKSNSCGGKYVLANGEGYAQTGTVKKIKGRGNTTWQKPKKPYNITFSDTINLDGLEGKKFSLLANYQDSSFIRNRLLYDMADEVGLPYSPDSRFVDFYVNGEYQGTYQLCDKVELGKSHLISLKDDASDTKTSEFNFCIEYVGPNGGAIEEDDIYVRTTRRNYGVLKNPEPDTSTAAGTTQLNWIKTKYQELENAIFSGDMAKVEAIADAESLAKMYLINEMSKNIDGGFTSMFFTYDASQGKFIATPVWDFDCAIGNLFNASGLGVAGLTIENTDGMYVKDCGSNNILAMFMKCSGAETLAGQIWEDEFVDAIKVMKGEATAENGRLKSTEAYKQILSDSLTMNYMMWPYASKNNRTYAGPDDKRVNDSFDWIPDQTKLTFYNTDLSTTRKTYALNFSDSINYVRDWAASRANWLTNYYSGESVPVEKQYYVAGTEELTGANWAVNDADNMMEQKDAIYQKEYTISNGAYRFKISQGTWNLDSWGYSDYHPGNQHDAVIVGTSGTNNSIDLTVAGLAPGTTVTVVIRFDPEAGAVSIEVK